MSARYNNSPKSREQMAEEGQAGFYRTADEERMSLCRAALREFGPCSAQVIQNFLIGAGINIDELATALHLERMVKNGQCTVQRSSDKTLYQIRRYR